jgi:hypothetical protein
VALSDYPDVSDFNNRYSDKRFRQMETEKRAKEIEEILKHIRVVFKPSSRTSIILSGEFNSVSNIDDQGYPDDYPVINMVQDEDFIDSYRSIHENTRIYRGYTKEIEGRRNVRSDYIFFKGSKLKVLDSDVIDHHPVKFPSKYFGLTTEFELK